MTERDIPESWSPARAQELEQMTMLSRNQQVSENASGVSATGSTSKSVKQRSNENSPEQPFDDQLQQIAPSKSLGKLPRWLKSWALWVFVLTLVPGGIAFVSIAMLLKLPSAPNCPSIFWPLASASVRINCAQLAASKQTVNDLLQAIALVKDLPKNHPLREEIDHHIEDWSQDILLLAKESFQAGRLQEAIATARRIPEDVSARKLVDEKIAKWQSIWSKAEEINKEAEEQIRQQHWHQAFMVASKLLRIDNKYWTSTRYDQLNQLIVRTREDGEKLAKAESLSKTSEVGNILKAIQLVGSIGKDSYIYQPAKDMIPTLGRRMLELAQRKLDKEDPDGAIEIAQQIPASTGLQMESEDFISIAQAQRSALTGTIPGLESAISQAQQIDSTRPSYEKAQNLIARWQLEIEDVGHLEKARSLSSGGGITDLTAAINEAQVIPASNPRSREARREIDHWVAQIQTIEDQPFMDRAEQLAVSEDINSLQAAIAEASQIRRGRALYREAQNKIGDWIGKIQRIEDQPYLDQARELAQSGDLPAAISTAQRIGTGRSLSREARRSINDWEEQIRAKENWRRAKEIALNATPSALAEAIRLADRVPNSSILRNDVNVALDGWSQQLLNIARSQGESDMLKGIETAKLIPKGTAAYREARQQIRTWREILNPPPVQPTPTPTPGLLQPSTIIDEQ
ncbi:chromosome segregation ATPase [Aetokthonos hydrillicola Thurmond2011]|jgi:hypothetical protein|uniref:Chromosome segregation ATPase n=1 Tax=Aetokthonos hydrillicola Thurmond2011 TaxID=2712845 RepID=A0AAP5I2T1_9CYAN|nr:chromosome segregation ATPase [Aetokthonos hydrillicola]MBO3457278.1 chromosome segregation ATPase [Aetokthonos hydrillicola CCALA 1050]MBW4586621.1 chromosome segregation ATPase [Aetokthonos hydrillicola CCALA 1050]MDR9894052.1 chromosome segregation ATPase [Aetokthonos hydrillicola Thurmond2011]